MNIEVYTAGRLVFGNKTYHCALGRSGVKLDKQEGDGATPAGCYRLRLVLYRADKIAKPKTRLKTFKIARDDGWCDDSASAEYNRLVKLPYSGSAERLWRGNDIYDVVVPIGYNDQPVEPGKGSAIFLHVATNDYKPTDGCVALALPDFLEVLAAVDTQTQICIHL